MHFFQKVSKKKKKSGNKKLIDYFVAYIGVKKSIATAFFNY